MTDHAREAAKRIREEFDFDVPADAIVPFVKQAIDAATANDVIDVRIDGPYAIKVKRGMLESHLVMILQSLKEKDAEIERLKEWREEDAGTIATLAGENVNQRHRIAALERVVALVQSDVDAGHYEDGPMTDALAALDEQAEPAAPDANAPVTQQETS